MLVRVLMIVGASLVALLLVTLGLLGCVSKRRPALGLIDGKLRVQGEETEEVVKQALAEIDAQDYEIITIYYGETVTAEQTEAMSDEISDLYPDQEIEVIDGGQPHYHYIVSVE